MGGTITGGTVTGRGPALQHKRRHAELVTISGNITLPVNTTFTANTNTTFTGGTATFGGNSLHLNGTGTALYDPWRGGVDRQRDGRRSGAASLAMVNNGLITNTAGGNYIYGGGNGRVHLPEHEHDHGHGRGASTLGNSGTDVITNQLGGLIEANGGNIGLGGARRHQHDRESRGHSRPMGPQAR